MRYFIVGFFLFSSFLFVEANQSPLCAYIYYAEAEPDYLNDVAINRVREIRVSDFSSREYAVALNNANVYSDVAYAQNPDMYVSYSEDASLGDAYGIYLNAPREGAEQMGDLFFVDNIRHLHHRWIDNTFIGHAAAAWSGDGRLAYAWNEDENGNEISDDYTIHLAIYNPLTDSRETNSFINTEPDSSLWILGWSADKQYFALLESGYSIYEFQHKTGFRASRIWIISAENLEAVPLATGETLTAESFAWSPTGAGFAYTLGNQVMIGAVEDTEYKTYLFGESETYPGSLQPNWSANGEYLAITQADEEYRWSHLLIELESDKTVHLEVGDLYLGNFDNPNMLTWSGDSQRWLYPVLNRGNTYRLLAYDMSTDSSLTLAETIVPAHDYGAYTADGLELYYANVAGIVGQAPVFAVLSPDNDAYQVNMLWDDGQSISLLENVNVVKMLWTSNQENLIVVTAEGDSQLDTLRMTAHWFNREGLLEGTYESEIIHIGVSVAEPYPAVLLLSREGLDFQAILLNLESNELIPLVAEAESDGSPYGYWNAGWWMEFPSADYLELRFEQPFPIYWYGDYVFRSDGTIPDVNLSNGEWTDDGSFVLLADYQSIEEDAYHHTPIYLRILEPEGQVLWEETIAAEEQPVDWFWGSCGMYPNAP